MASQIVQFIGLTGVGGYWRGRGTCDHIFIIWSAVLQGGGGGGGAYPKCDKKETKSTVPYVLCSFYGLCLDSQSSRDEQLHLPHTQNCVAQGAKKEDTSTQVLRKRRLAPISAAISQMVPLRCKYVATEVRTEQYPCEALHFFKLSPHARHRKGQQIRSV